VGLGSSQGAARRVHAELWSWSAWLVLCIISYPAVLLLLLAPRAGAVAGLAAGSVLIAATALGQTGRWPLEAWPRAAGAALGVGSAVAAVARLGDGAGMAAAALCGGAAGCQLAFVWHFVPWMVQEAQAGESQGGEGLQPLSRGRRRPAPARVALASALLLGLLTLGLGATWAPGETWAPDPTLWVVALALLALGLMFVERMGFLERSAREGNLSMPKGSFRKWILAGALLLGLAAAAAALLPALHAREQVEGRRVGTEGAPTEAPAARAAGALQEMLQRLGAGLSSAASALARAPRGILALWLLLLLLLLLLVAVWAFRRSRLARWLLAAVAWACAKIARAWARLAAAVRRWLAPASPTSPTAHQVPADDPLFDIFEHPELVGRISPREAVIRTYHLLLNYAEMLGHGRGAGETPLEYAETVRRVAPGASDSLMVLTWGYAGAMYGGESAPLPDLPAVGRAWRRLAGALISDLSAEELALRRRAYLTTRRLGRP